MSRVRPLEIKALMPLVEQDWPTPEALCEAVIKALDVARASRTSYAAVMQYGEERPCWYLGLGPYPGAASAKKAAARHPGAGMAFKIAVVPLLSEHGLQSLLEGVDAMG